MSIHVLCICLLIYMIIFTLKFTLKYLDVLIFCSGDLEKLLGDNKSVNNSKLVLSYQQSITAAQ